MNKSVSKSWLDKIYVELSTPYLKKNGIDWIFVLNKMK